jgi:flagellar motor switch protein FliM
MSTESKDGLGGGERSAATSLLAHVDRGVLGLVQDLFRTAARRIRTRLVNRSGADILVRYGTAEISSLGKVLHRLQTQEGGAFARFRVSPGEVPGLMVIQGPLLYRLEGILLGENMESTSSLYRWRPLTAVDVRIARRICEDALDGIMRACVMPVRPRARLEAVSANPRLPFSLPSSTTVVEVSLDFGPPDDPYGLMSIVLPGQATGILWPKGSGRRPVQTESRAEGMQRVMPVPVTAVAELGRVRMPLSEVKKICVGTSIDLGFEKDVEIRVGDRLVMNAQGGIVNGRRSVKIKSRAEESDSS